jgi:hypothetical protein
VSWNSISEKWRAQLCHGDEVHHLKLHESEVEAAHAYDRLAIKLKKGSAVTNFPVEEYKEYQEYVAQDRRGAMYFGSLDGGETRSYDLLDFSSVFHAAALSCGIVFPSATTNIWQDHVQSRLFKRDVKMTAEQSRLRQNSSTIVICMKIGSKGKRKCPAWW